MRKRHRDLKRQFPLIQIETTNSGHLRLRLPNGRCVFTSSTTRNWRAEDNLRTAIRRRLKMEGRL